MRWRRRRFQKLRRKERKKWASGESAIVVNHYENGVKTKKVYTFPRAHVPKGVPVWNPKIGKPPKLEPGQMMVMNLEINVGFHRCEDCGFVWTSPDQKGRRHQHTRSECKAHIVQHVMDS